MAYVSVRPFLVSSVRNLMYLLRSKSRNSNASSSLGSLPRITCASNNLKLVKDIHLTRLGWLRDLRIEISRIHVLGTPSS